MGRPLQDNSKLSPNASRLELPTNCRADTVFNVSVLKKYHANDTPDRVQRPPLPVTDLDGNQRYYIKKVLDCRERRGKTQYLLKWIGYRDPTWEPEAYLCDAEGGHLFPMQEFLRQ